jgi:hypothetical protein
MDLDQPFSNYAFGGFFACGFEALKVNILGQNLEHILKRLKKALRFFLGAGKFLVASKWAPKGKTLPVDCELMKSPTNLKLRGVLHTINIGPRNFIQTNWSTR